MNMGQLRLEVERILGRERVEGIHRIDGDPINPGQIAERACALAKES
jgi:2-oxoglutarate ferredoxin oxidoreductase subunit alpha